MVRISYIRILLSLTLLLLLLISSAAYLLIYLPYSLAALHEEAYFNDLFHHPNPHSPSTKNQTTIKPEPLTTHAHQLSTFNYETQLQLHKNRRRTAMYPLQRRWVYLSGTPPIQPRTWLEKISIFSPPGKGSCVDSPAICSAFNTAFDTLAWKSRGPISSNRIRTSLSFVDCDHSPLLCDELRLDPITLLHLETRAPCFVRKNYTFECSTRWTAISLPLKQMPFGRQVRMGGVVVPAFPSAVEQLRMLLLWDGSMAGLGLGEEFVLDALVGEEGSGYTFEGVEKGDDGLYEEKMRELAGFFAMIVENTSY